MHSSFTCPKERLHSLWDDDNQCSAYQQTCTKGRHLPENTLHGGVWIKDVSHSTRAYDHSIHVNLSTLMMTHAIIFLATFVTLFISLSLSVLFSLLPSSLPHACTPLSPLYLSLPISLTYLREREDERYGARHITANEHRKREK